MIRDAGQLSPSRCFGHCEREHFKKIISELEKELRYKTLQWEGVKDMLATESSRIAELGKVLAGGCELICSYNIDDCPTGIRLWAKQVRESGYGGKV